MCVCVCLSLRTSTLCVRVTLDLPTPDGRPLPTPSTHPLTQHYTPPIGYKQNCLFQAAVRQEGDARVRHEVQHLLVQRGSGGGVAVLSCVWERGGV